MAVRFPHGGSSTVSDLEFIGAWKLLGELIGPSEWQWDQDAMPRSNRAESLDSILGKGLCFGLDALCRCLVEDSYRNTMHATNPFMEANQHLLLHEQAVNPASNRSIKGARLSEHALQVWDEASVDERERVLRIAGESLQPLLGSRSDETQAQHSPNEPRSLRPVDTPGPSEALLSRALPGALPEDICALVSEGLSTGGMFATCDPLLLIRASVEWIAQDAFQQIRRRSELVGGPVTGWPSRLREYFWDARGYAETCSYLKPIAEEAMCLARRLEDVGEWSETEGGQAVQLAQKVFTWGGRSPDEVTAEAVRKVFWNALQDELVHDGAPMGSGWSKVAAFATNHLEAEERRDPQAIWDSRVSTAIVSRLDRMLIAAGAREVPLEFRDIGPANVGQGGTRPRDFELRWCNAYAKWRCQFAGSNFVRAMRDILNGCPRPASDDSYPPMPLPDGTSAPWTVRGVEMVLFMDGY